MPLKYGRLRKGVLEALSSLKQQSLEAYLKELDIKAEQRIQEQKEYEAVYETILPKLVELHNKGLSYREIGQKLGISHASIARYIKIQEAKELKEEVKNNGKM